MAPSHRQMKAAAVRFFYRQAQAQTPAELEQLLQIGQLDMMRRFGLPAVDAYNLVVAAWSEASGRASGFHFALEISTPWLIFIVDPETDRIRPVPIADLLDFYRATTPPAGEQPPPSRPGPRLVHDASADADPTPAA